MSYNFLPYKRLKKKLKPGILFFILTIIFFIEPGTGLWAHLCDNVFRQADKLIVKPENYNMVVKDKSEFKIFLQNNMDRGIAEISLIAESPAFDFDVTPHKMSIPKDQRAYFNVLMQPKKDSRTGNYPVNFRLVGGGRQFKSFSLGASADEGGKRTRDEKIFRPVKKNFSSKEDKKKPRAELLKIPPTLNSPDIDGVTNEAAWKKAGIISNFSAEDGGKAVYQTIGLFMHNQKKLFAGVYSCDERVEEISADDKIEILFSGDESYLPVYSITLPRSGNPYYKKKKKDGSYSKWEPYGIEYAINNDDETWSCELSIPFSVIGLGKMEEPKKWSLRINRMKATGNAEKSFWSQDDSGYNNVEGLGRVMILP